MYGIGGAGGGGHAWGCQQWHTCWHTCLSVPTPVRTPVRTPVGTAVGTRDLSAHLFAHLHVGTYTCSHTCSLCTAWAKKSRPIHLGEAAWRLTCVVRSLLILHDIVCMHFQIGTKRLCANRQYAPRRRPRGRGHQTTKTRRTKKCRKGDGISKGEN